jgi:hypothetical protein
MNTACDMNLTNVLSFDVDVLVDVGNEIDDEQLLRYLETIWQSLEAVSDEDSGIRFNMRFVFCGFNKLSDADSMKRWITKFAYPESAGVGEGNAMDMPKCIAEAYRQDFGSDLGRLDLAARLTYTTCAEYIACPGEIWSDYVLVCASMRGWDGSNLNVRKRLFFQGNIEELVDSETGAIVSPKGLNAVGSEDFIATMKGKMGHAGAEVGHAGAEVGHAGAEVGHAGAGSGAEFIVVPSERCAEMRPTARYIKSLSGNFKTETAEAGFKLMVGRIAPGIVLPNGIELSKKIAAGLVNPSRGRGANYEAMKSFMKLIGSDLETDFDFDSIDSTHLARVKKIGENYFKRIFDISTDELPEVITYNDVDENGEVVKKSFDWDRDQTLKNITLINLGLEFVCPGIWDGRDLPFYSNFTPETPDEALAHLRGVYLAELEKVANDAVIGFLNPSYDLFLGWVFTSYVFGGDEMMNYALKQATPVEFFTAVSI